MERDALQQADILSDSGKEIADLLPKAAKGDMAAKERIRQIRSSRVPKEIKGIQALLERYGKN